MLLEQFNSGFCKPCESLSTPTTTVAETKIHERKMKYTGESQELPSEESNPVTDPLGETVEFLRRNIRRAYYYLI